MPNIDISQNYCELSCKVCGSPAPVLGAIDFIRPRKEWLNYAPPVSGLMVFYNQCSSCNFLFTTGFDHWGYSEFTTYIYNEFYKFMDTGAPERELNNAKGVGELFAKSKDSIKILDFGGGSGGFSHALRNLGFEVDTFDPYMGRSDSIKAHSYDLITCYEVLEHTTNPQSTMNEIIALLKTDGIVLFSTLVQPVDFQDRGLFWWYVSPRSGHVSIHSKKSLVALWGTAGFKVSSFDDNSHVAYKNIPSFASHLFKENKASSSLELITKPSMLKRIKRKLESQFKRIFVG